MGKSLEQFNFRMEKPFLEISPLEYMNGVRSGFCTGIICSPVQLEGRPPCSCNACSAQLECRPNGAGPVQLECRPRAARMQAQCS